MFGVLVHRLQVVERGRRIGQLANALVVFALAAANATEVKPKNGEPHVVKGIVQVIDHAIVHCAAELRMRMQDDRDWRILDFLRMIAAFQTTFRSGKYYFGHVFPYSSTSRAPILDEFGQGL